MAQAVLIKLPASIEASKVEEVLIENFTIPNQEINITIIPDKKAEKDKKSIKKSKRYAKYHQENQDINKLKAKLDAKVYRNSFSMY